MLAGLSEESGADDLASATAFAAELQARDDIFPDVLAAVREVVNRTPVAAR